MENNSFSGGGQDGGGCGVDDGQDGDVEDVDDGGVDVDDGGGVGDTYCLQLPVQYRQILF